MNGTTLTLGLAGLLAGASALSRRGSRATVRYVYPTRQAMKEANDRFFAALEEFAGTSQVVYIGPFVMVGDRTGDVLGKLEIDVGSNHVDGTLCVRLAYIGVSADSRNKGFGRRLLQIVCDAADKVGLPIELEVDPQKKYGQRKPPMNKVQLRDFYAKFGFKKVKGMGSDYMVRPASPQGSANGDERLERLLEIVRKYEGEDLDMPEAWRPFLRDMKEAGFETLGSGGTRYVYALDDDRVAKIDYDPDGSSNEAEYDAWRDFSRMGGGDLLVPVLGRREDGRVLIMARAEPIPKSRLKEIPKARRALALPREQADHEFNWGLHEGIVKLLDYAS